MPQRVTLSAQAKIEVQGKEVHLTVGFSSTDDGAIERCFEKNLAVHIEFHGELLAITLVGFEVSETMTVWRGKL